MKKSVMILALCVGMSSGVWAQPEAQPWWANKWLWIGAAGTLFAGWATLSSYFKKRLDVKCGKDQWKQVKVRPNFAQVSFQKDPVRLVPTFSEVLANSFLLESKKTIGGIIHKWDVSTYSIKRMSSDAPDFTLYICSDLQKDTFSFTDTTGGSKKEGTINEASWFKNKTLKTMIRWSGSDSNERPIEGSFMIGGHQMHRLEGKKQTFSKQDLILLGQKLSSGATQFTHIIIAIPKSVSVNSNVLDFVLDGSLHNIFKNVNSITIAPLYQGFYYYNLLLNGQHKETGEKAFPAAIFVQ